jgi:hypothetical protein
MADYGAASVPSTFARAIVVGNWMPITPKTGSLFHAETHPKRRLCRRLGAPSYDETGINAGAAAKAKVM